MSVRSNAHHRTLTESIHFLWNWLHSRSHLMFGFKFLLIFFALLCLITLDAKAQPKFTETSSNTHIAVIEIGYYNPITGKHHQAYQHSIQAISALGNDDLVFLAASLQEGHSVSLRLLNNQWLEYHHNQRAVRSNGRAVSKIVQMGLKSYWNRIKQKRYKHNHAIPNGDGSGSFGFMEYDVDLHGDSLEVDFVYRF